MSKRTAGRFAIAGVLTGVYAAGVAQARKDIGSEGTQMTAEKVAKMAIVAAVMSGLTWLAATL